MNSAPSGAARLLPEVLSVAADDDNLAMQARVPEDLLYLDGHFSGTPVVAGVVQLAWAQHYARSLLHLSGGIRRVEQLKFQRLLRPPHPFTLSISLDRLAGVASYRIYHDQHTYSSGRIHFGPPAG